MYEPPAGHLRRMEQIAGEGRLHIAKSETQAKELIPEAEIVMGNRYFLQSLPFARKLRWMQSNSVGVDLILTQKDRLQKNGVLLTCARGVYDAELAEHTLAMILALYRGLPDFRADQHTKTWRRHSLKTLRGSRCMLLGWGSLGRHLAKILAFLGAEVAAARNLDDDSIEDGVHIWSRKNWRHHLAQTDILILCLPKTPDTLHLVSEKELAMLPSNAIVVNIGRGGTLDDQALLRFIRIGRLAGAALDVFEQEPLPPESLLWNEPRVLISPHAGRSLEVSDFKWFSLFEENLTRYLSDQPLLNLVDYDKGY